MSRLAMYIAVCFSFSLFSFLIGFTTEATWPCLQSWQNQCWSVSHATSTHHLDVQRVKKTPPQQKPTDTQRQALYKKPERPNRPVPTSQSPRLTVQNKVRKPRKVPFKHARTTGWCLYGSTSTSIPPLLQPSLDGRQRESRKCRVSDEKKKHPHLTFKTRKSAVHTLQPLTPVQWAQQHHPLKFCPHLPSRNQRRRTLPHASQHSLVSASWPYSASTWMTDVDIRAAADTG